MTTKIMCVVASAPQYRELREIVQILKGASNTQVTFVFDQLYPQISENTYASEALGDLVVEHHSMSTYPKITFPNVNWRQSARRVLNDLPVHIREPVYQLGRYAFYTSPLTYAYWQRKYEAKLSYCRSVLFEHNPDVVLLAVDAAYYDTGFWVHAAREKNIKTVLVPFAMADQITLAEERSQLVSNSTAIFTNWLTAKRHPEWCYDFDGRKILLMSGVQILAKIRLGLSFKNPWIYNNSHADCILLESDYALKQLADQGADISNCVVTGRSAHDELSKIATCRTFARNSLIEKYGFDSEKPIVLAAVTPDKFDSFGQQTEFSSYKDLIASWCRVLTSNDKIQILLSIHPSGTDEVVSQFQSQTIRILEEPLAEALPIVDLYVTDCSATCRLAAASGIPVIDYDLYRFDLAYNRVGSGLVSVKTNTDFLRVWNRVWDEPDWFNKLKSKQVRNSQAFGLLDGESGDRIRILILSLVENII